MLRLAPVDVDRGDPVTPGGGHDRLPLNEYAVRRRKVGRLSETGKGGWVQNNPRADKAEAAQWGGRH